MRTIVVVEDEVILGDLIASELKKKEFEVFTAHDGAEGWAMIQDKVPDLVLLDLLMPGMSGYDVLTELRHHKDLKDIPCIVISNSGQADDLNRAYTSGANDVLIKANFNPAQVVTKVEELLNKGKVVEGEEKKEE
jgi:DNA-binding response OmpR family regulator